MTLTKTLHEPEAFVDWLQSLPTNEPVGRAITVCNCPVAEFLRSLNYNHISVGSTSVVAYYQGEPNLLLRGATPLQEQMPDWLFLFVQWIDGLVYGGQIALEPTAKDCLYILKRYCNVKDA